MCSSDLRGEFDLGRSAALSLPQSAVLLRDGFSYVFRIGADNKVVRLKVAIGRRVDDRVEIVGGPPGKRVAFRTGLWPSPNTAAQAGGMDPARAAVAALPGGASDTAGPLTLPEFRVIQLRSIEGGCG